MFSITTMASSTTKPVAMVSAMSVRLLMLKPARYMTPKVPTMEIGTATAGMTVAVGLRRKTKITITTSAMASISSNCTSCTEARIVTVRSVSSLHVDRRRQGRGERGQQLLHAVHHLDHVGARLALDVHDDRGRVVHPRGELGVLRRRRSTSAMSSRWTGAPLR